MFILDYIWATATLLVLIALGAYLMYANPETNWGSSVQAQVFVDAVKSVHVLTETPDHVKTYRPKILCLTGNPAHRPALVDFANIITKKTSLLICGHVLNDPAPVNLYKLREDVQFWLKDHAIKGFYTVNQSSSFEEGAKNCITMAGLGKMAPNLVLLGFKANWKSQLEAMSEYINSMYCAFDQKLSFGILRVQDGFDYSSEIVEEQLLVKEVPVQEGDHSDDEQPANPNELALKPKTRKVSTAVYRGAGGLPLENKMLANIQMFKETKQRRPGTLTSGGSTMTADLLCSCLTSSTPGSSTKVASFASSPWPTAPINWTRRPGKWPLCWQSSGSTTPMSMSFLMSQRRRTRASRRSLTASWRDAASILQICKQRERKLTGI
jgi:hypothetical protein